MVLAFWHNQLLTMPCLYFGPPFGISTLIPLSRDGDLTSRIVHRWGIGTVRGSSSKRETAAMKELLRLGLNPRHHFALTPDGPRGPAFEVKDGLLILAQETGRPIVPLAVAYDRYLRLAGWDGFLVPVPFTKAYFVCGDPVHIPGNLSPEALSELRDRVTRALALTNALAMSKRGKKP